MPSQCDPAGPVTVLPPQERPPSVLTSAFICPPSRCGVFVSSFVINDAMSVPPTLMMYGAPASLPPAAVYTRVRESQLAPSSLERTELTENGPDSVFSNMHLQRKPQACLLPKAYMSVPSFAAATDAMPSRDVMPPPDTIRALDHVLPPSVDVLTRLS